MKTHVFTTLVAGIILSACGGSSTPAPTPTAPSPQPAAASTTFQGIVAGSGGQSGTLTLTIQAVIASSSVRPLAVSQGSGTLHLVGASTVALTGTYDSVTSAVSFAGGGFTFAGTVSGGALAGTYGGPNGSRGGFSSLNGTGATVTVYCGTLKDPTTGSLDPFNIAVSASGAISGVVSDNRDVISLRGQLAGTAATLTGSDGGSFGPVIIQNGSVTGPGITGSTTACSG